MSNLVPEGIYEAVAVEVADDSGVYRYAHLTESKNGTKQVAMRFRIIGGEFKGRTLSWFGAFTSKAWSRTAEALRYCGFKGTDILDVENQTLNGVVSVTVEHNTYEGETKARIAWVNPLGGMPMKISHLSDSKRDEFKAVMQGKLSNVPEVEPARIEAAASEKNLSNGADWPPPPPPPEDDIPF